MERKITPRTKAIMPVHLYGLPCDMDPIMALAEKHNLIVIEDAAQCFLGEYKGRLAGTIGHMASFSFENTKHMSTGDGGIVITNDERLAEAVRKFSCLGYSMVTAASGQVRTKAFAFQDPNYKRHTSFGWQYRMPEVAAAIGMAQLARLNEYVAKRQQIWALYADAVKDCSYIKPQRTPPGYVNACWTFAARYEGEEAIGVSWHDFAEKFRELSGEGDLCRLVGGLSRTGHCRTAVLRRRAVRSHCSLVRRQGGMGQGPLPDGRSRSAEADAVQGQHRRPRRGPATGRRAARHHRVLWSRLKIADRCGSPLSPGV